MKSLLWLLCMLLSGVTWSQQLSNSSMEGEPLDATMPDGWHACQEGTTPDILPGAWGVESEASDGDTYVGLITRPNGTWEAIGQRFSLKLKANACYNMAVIAAHADTYAGYNKSGRMRIWLGTSKCDCRLMILDVKLLKHEEWKHYPIQFITDEAYEFLIIESFFPDGIKSAAGNILIDQVFAPVACDRT